MQSGVKYENWQNLSKSRRNRVLRVLREEGNAPITQFTAEYFFKGEGNAVHVALRGREIAGIAFSRLTDNYKGEAHSVLVTKKYRGIGLGPKLFLQSLSWLRMHGMNVARVPITNPKAASRLKKMGFESKWTTKPQVMTGEESRLTFTIKLNREETWKKIRELVSASARE